MPREGRTSWERWPNETMPLIAQTSYMASIDLQAADLRGLHPGCSVFFPYNRLMVRLYTGHVLVHFYLALAQPTGLAGSSAVTVNIHFYLALPLWTFDPGGEGGPHLDDLLVIDAHPLGRHAGLEEAPHRAPHVREAFPDVHPVLQAGQEVVTVQHRRELDDLLLELTQLGLLVRLRLILVGVGSCSAYYIHGWSGTESTHK
jgi:hypothetical protein